MFEEENELENDSGDMYSDEGREKLVEDDEIEPWEEGFMEGAEGDGQQAKCRNCGKILTTKNTIEKEIEGEVCWFCSEKCLEEHEMKEE